MSKYTSHCAKPEHLDNSEHVNAAGPDQNKPDDALKQLKAKIVEDQCKRYIIQKTTIGKTYNVSVFDMEDSINALFETSASYAAHQVQLQRLQQLLAQKTSIEASMAKQLASLRATYNAHSRDLDMVVQRYMREMK
ncbi:hypothetical protein PTMSG1_05594 [Pyrenophora teres f. maculata]|nr:hypothetical protein PTMSG1_05594 [Pyrenophora teres f. maculata]